MVQVIQYDLILFIIHLNAICCSGFPTLVLYAFLWLPTRVTSPTQAISLVNFIYVLKIFAARFGYNYSIQ
jgi:hypothetical protein